MGFKVYQGSILDANLLAISHVGTVVVTGDVDRPYRLAQEAKPFSEAKLPASTEIADMVSVFINEDLGRRVIVKWDAMMDGPMQVSLPRTQKATAITPSQGQWLVIADADNVEPSLLDASYQSTLPLGWRSGPTAEFTTSLCGLDSFIVTYRIRDGRGWLSRHLIVTVRKRIRCHLFEMLRSNKAGPTDTFTEYRAPLTKARNVYSDQFGIDLVFPNDGQIIPEGTNPFQSQVADLRMIRAADAPNRSPRDLWINVVNSIESDTSDTEPGVTGDSLVTLGVQYLMDLQVSFPNMRNQWNSYKSNNAKPTVEEFGAILQLDESQMNIVRGIAEGSLSPTKWLEMGGLAVSLHEIGHALGLVPRDAKAGGKKQNGWAGVENHCSKRSCVMFDHISPATFGRGRQAELPPMFDHNMSNDALDKCTLYLRACDLHDIRKFPAG